MHCGALQLLSSMMMRGRLCLTAPSPSSLDLLSARVRAPVDSMVAPCCWWLCWTRDYLCGVFFLTIFASRFGHCRGQSCVFAITSDTFRIVIHCRNKTHFVKSENGFKFNLKDVSLAFVFFFKLKQVDTEKRTKRSNLLQKQH